MRKSRFTGAQIAHALRQAETGTPATVVCRVYGVSEQGFHRWKKRCGGLRVNETRRLKQLEEENNGLKQLVAEFSFYKLILQRRAAKKL